MLFRALAASTICRICSVNTGAIRMLPSVRVLNKQCAWLRESALRVARASGATLAWLGRLARGILRLAGRCQNNYRNSRQRRGSRASSMVCGMAIHCASAAGGKTRVFGIFYRLSARILSKTSSVAGSTSTRPAISFGYMCAKTRTYKPPAMSQRARRVDARPLQTVMRVVPWLFAQHCVDRVQGRNDPIRPLVTDSHGLLRNLALNRLPRGRAVKAAFEHDRRGPRSLNHCFNATTFDLYQLGRMCRLSLRVRLR